MKLMTRAIEKKLSKRPFGTTANQGIDAEVVVKFFNPCGAGTWLVTEGEQLENGDWEFYGYVELGYEWERGYFRLSELLALRGRAHVREYGSFTLPMERDIHSRGTVKQLMM